MARRLLGTLSIRRREMVTGKSTDSSDSVLGPTDRQLPLDLNIGENPGGCPTSWPSCDPPSIKDPAPSLPERAAPTTP
jgi:hypothetical protein